MTMSIQPARNSARRYKKGEAKRANPTTKQGCSAASPFHRATAFLRLRPPTVLEKYWEFIQGSFSFYIRALTWVLIETGTSRWAAFLFLPEEDLTLPFFTTIGSLLESQTKVNEFPSLVVERQRNEVDTLAKQHSQTQIRSVGKGDNSLWRQWVPYWVEHRSLGEKSWFTAPTST